MPYAVCHDHKEYVTPLVSTIVFAKAEFWCPYCGRKYGLFEPDPAEDTDELKARHAIYDEKSLAYLRAMGAVAYGAKVWHNGEWIDPSMLPVEIQDEYARIRAEGWQLQRKAEEL
jgi:hypothetical protein